MTFQEFQNDIPLHVVLQFDGKLLRTSLGIREARLAVLISDRPPSYRRENYVRNITC